MECAADGDLICLVYLGLVLFYFQLILRAGLSL